MFDSLPLSERRVKATEAHLRAIYDAARLGLRSDNLAYAAGLTPTELRRLHELDPLAKQAEEKGRADAEQQLAGQLYAAAMNGDAKAALEILKHRHDWVAKQQVQVDISQQISITAALEQAQARTITIDQPVENGYAQRLGPAEPEHAAGNARRRRHSELAHPSTVPAQPQGV
jgi:hypothetical protein